MNAKDLIKEYDETAQAEENARKQAYALTIENARETFLRLCRIWLGELWDEFQPGEIKYREITSYSRPYLSLSLPISFMGIPGEIEGHYTFSVRPSETWSCLQINFDNLGARNLFVNLNEGAPANPRDLGRLLSAIEKYAPIRAENERQALEKRRADALKFYGQNLHHISTIGKEVEERIVEFPDMETEIRAAAAKVILSIAEAEKERQAQEIQYAKEQEERRRLSKLGELAWASPFTVYKISFGAFIGDGEGGMELYAESIYTLEPDPDHDGYYLAFSEGVLRRKIRPEHVLSTEEITITNQKDAPYEIKRFVELRSKELPEVTAMVYLPARQFFVFDIEEVGAMLDGETAQNLDGD